ncbi:hypothetical protein [Oricola thermophila]|uniref:Uncharacterized protein n=1 Tax=Oricola thermophila TaxID=2742145 RepID=A0A6N1VBH4_9HYPH|nr:hypothetical protein [Oricola thermophila]QKV18028.1 hypothetical protein HTY61_05900 [Oricola thermophila]
MKRTIRTLWRTNRILVIAFAVAVLFTLAFGLRATVFYMHRPPPDGEIAGWMTVRHIARSNDIDPLIVKEALGLDLEAHDHRPLARIARDRGLSPDILVETLRNAIDEAREAQEPRP